MFEGNEKDGKGGSSAGATTGEEKSLPIAPPQKEEDRGGLRSTIASSGGKKGRDFNLPWY